MSIAYTPHPSTPLPVGSHSRTGEAWATEVTVRSYDGAGSMYEVDAYRNGWRIDSKTLIDEGAAHRCAHRWASYVTDQLGEQHGRTTSAVPALPQTHTIKPTKGA